MAEETLHARRDRIKVGDVFGRLTVLEWPQIGKRRVRCRCACGIEREVDTFSLQRGRTISCGCSRAEKRASWNSRGRIFKIVPGDIFGRLTVVRCDPDDNSKWICRCSCGVDKSIRHGSLGRGSTVSCGCYYKSKPTRTHGMRHSREYACWRGIKERCANINNKGYYRYGGRGISICREWVSSFETFFRDMGPRPSPKHSIERINVNGNYEPGNTRWATAREQARNRRGNRHLVAFGRSQTLAAWSMETGISDQTISGRLKRGWPVEEALSQMPSLHCPHRS